mmetsp:Transcript_31742/g.53710  ORF Transcript_31742/g.53710 Transcript_31742/m.53710 type:complete len:357 (-) Transcript_31742:165-1235(-)
MEDPNPSEFFFPRSCDLSPLPREKVVSCFKHKKIVLVGDSTTYELFLELVMRSLDVGMAGRYDLIHRDPTAEECKSTLKTDEISPDSIRPCYTHVINTTESSLPVQEGGGRGDERRFGAKNRKMPSIHASVDHFQLPLYVFRKLANRSKAAAELESQIAFVMFKTAQMHHNFGGIGVIGKEPFHIVFQNAANWGDVIIINNVLHSMGRKRRLEDFPNKNRSLADFHFNSLARRYEKDFIDVALPELRGLAQRGKRVIWWTGNRPSFIGTRPLLHTYHPTFISIARKAIRDSNRMFTEQIGFLDTTQFSASQGHNSSMFTDGIHFGAWAILPRRARSTLVAKVTGEFVLNAACDETS